MSYPWCHLYCCPLVSRLYLHIRRYCTVCFLSEPIIPGLTADHHSSFTAAPPLRALSAYRTPVRLYIRYPWAEQVETPSGTSQYIYQARYDKHYTRRICNTTHTTINMAGLTTRQLGDDDYYYGYNSNCYEEGRCSWWWSDVSATRRKTPFLLPTNHG